MNIELSEEQIVELEEIFARSDTGAKFDNLPWNSLEFDKHKWSESPKIDALAEKNAELGLPAKGFRRDRSILHMKIILLNLYSCSSQNGVSYVAYSRGQNRYQASSRYNEHNLNRKYVVNAVDILRGNDLIDHVGGFDGRNPRMRANTTLQGFFDELGAVKFISAPRRECILIRDDEKRPIKYGVELGLKSDPQFVTGMRKRLNKVNALISNADIQLEIPENELINFNYQQRKDGEQPIDFSKFFLQRKFKNKFNLGGRHYGGWWQNAPKAMRHHILIDGVETVELDFTGIHPSLVYLKETGRLPVGDPYTLPGYEGDGDMRSLVKQILLVMLNSSYTDEADALKKLTRNIERTKKLSNASKKLFTGTGSESVLKLLRMQRAAIWTHVGNNEGLGLQYLDSKIADQIISQLSEQGIVCLPVFDSFIVQSKNEDLLKNAMQKAFTDQWNACPEIKVN